MMEIAAAGDDHKALRKIAAALLAKAGDGDGPAINSLADRTDGKVAPSSDWRQRRRRCAAGPHNARVSNLMPNRRSRSLLKEPRFSDRSEEDRAALANAEDVRQALIDVLREGIRDSGGRELKIQVRDPLR